MSAKIALVDDDRNITMSVSLALESEGYEVRTYHDGQAGLHGIQHEEPDIAILDIKMPRMDGMELLSKLRETLDIPVIFLTSKGDELDEALGLRMGADDYITKPFSQRLLLERIRALLRRQDHIKNNIKGSEQKQNITKRGHMTLCDAQYRCTWKNETVDLTVTEYLLVKALAQHPGHIKSRDQLIDQAYGETIYVDDRTIDSHIKRVRKKFKAIDPDFTHIETRYGAGYAFKQE